MGDVPTYAEKLESAWHRALDFPDEYDRPLRDPWAVDAGDFK